MVCDGQVSETFRADAAAADFDWDHLKAFLAVARTGDQIEIVARATDSGVAIEVRDSGPGIPAELGEEIFSPFKTSKPFGTGLGLSIVRDYAQAHGGTVEVVDDPHRAGARLRVTLPLRRGGLA